MTEHDHADLPPHVQDALAELDEQEIKLLLRLLRAMSSLEHVGKLLLWIVAAGLGALIIISQAMDAVKKLMPPKFFLMLFVAVVATAV